MNKLHLETSPYLLQHANNPVYWQAWNNHSLAQAKNNNQLIIISIGYSACHWCHVMEHESFENDEVAQTMNAHFVNIKIDREERPDIDAVYMKAIQIMTGQGGWPLNVVALPDGRPVWGGTYFRKPDWINALQQLQNLFQTNPEKMIDYAEKLHQGIQSINIVEENDFAPEYNPEILKNLVHRWKKSFDHEYGGMESQPKFMMPNNYSFLLRYAHQTSDAELLNFVNLTITKMTYGGLFDTVDGGFSRYSVDMKWHVPHFEKMLYDNGQLISLYANAYKLSRNPLYEEVIKKTLTFVIREFSNNHGGYYSALDADSLNNIQELEEGAFYVWTKPELQKILKDDFLLFSIVFNVNEFGYWEHDNYVLIQNDTLENIAQKNNIAMNELIYKKQSWEKLLFIEREKRSKPRLDDKCLTSWNAIILKGFVDAYKALETDEYLQKARECAEFILQNLLNPEGNLHRNYKNGQSTINGYLDDYAWIINSFIALYEVTLDEKWLWKSKELMEYCLEYFYDNDQQLFSFTSQLDDPLIVKHFENDDNVIPASNSVMAHNLFQLNIYFAEPKYEKIMFGMLQKIIPNISYPSAYSNWMHLYLNLSHQNKELAITGKDALDYVKKINKQFLPNLTLAGSNKPSELPYLKDKFDAKKTLFYLCQNKNCMLPTENFEAIIKEI